MTDGAERAVSYACKIQYAVYLPDVMDGLRLVEFRQCNRVGLDVRGSHVGSGQNV